MKRHSILLICLKEGEILMIVLRDSFLNSGASSSKSVRNENQKVYIMRHGERIDLTFRGWIPHCFTADGKYIRRDLNLPKTIPRRASGMQGYINDSPLTNLGVLQAELTGEALSDANVLINFAYSSPSFRCVQTCHAVLTGLGLQDSIAIRIEPGLFEWLVWYREEQPDWMKVEELIDAGYNIDASYVPVIAKNDLFGEDENLEQFYKRSNVTVTSILTKSTEGNIFLTGHAATIEMCSRQLVGLQPRTINEVYKILEKVGYCTLIALEKKSKKWHLVQPPCPPMTNTDNHGFDWNVLL